LKSHLQFIDGEAVAVASLETTYAAVAHAVVAPLAREAAAYA
jgi:hypothetical protein